MKSQQQLYFKINLQIDKITDFIFTITFSGQVMQTKTIIYSQTVPTTSISVSVWCVVDKIRRSSIHFNCMVGPVTVNFREKFLMEMDI